MEIRTLHFQGDTAKPLSYRSDIDGLRGVAVLLVVAFHALPNWIEGGFIGVDIFFVISGFLISSILLGGLHNNTFSFTNFYQRRIRRIFPALILVLFCSLIAAWFVLMDSEFISLGKYTWTGAAFITNLTVENGYFETDSNLKPLLHLWTLGIEEQFYILWPMVLFFSWKRSLNLFKVIASFFVVSFGLNILGIIFHYPEAAFYLPLTRFWELMAGSLLAFVSLHGRDYAFMMPIQGRALLCNRYLMSANSIVATVGLALIVGAVIVLQSGPLFPGWRAAVPVLGTLLVIAAGPKAWLNRYIFSNRSIVFVGVISYPLYLWHWPLLSFARIVTYGEPSCVFKLLLVIFSFLLAWLTFWFVERPVRWGWMARKIPGKLICVLLLALAFIGIIGVTIYKGYFPISQLTQSSKRFEFGLADDRTNLAPEYERLFREECNCETVKELDSSCFTPHSKTTLFIWGDSHAQHLNAGLRNYFAKDSISFLQIAASSCPPAIPDNYENVCDRSNGMALEKITELHPDVVVLSQRGPYDLSILRQVIYKLWQMKIRTVLVGPAPQWKPPLYLILFRRFEYFHKEIPLRFTVGLNHEMFRQDSILKEEFAASTTVKYVSLMDGLCNEDGCLTRVGNSLPEDLVTFDYGHLSESGSTFIANEILGPTIRDLLAGPQEGSDSMR